MTDEDGFEKVGDVRQGDDKIPRGHDGRYILPHPHTGAIKRFTRVTTISEMLKSRRQLEQWDQRNVVYGLGQRPALYAQASAAKLTDRKTLDKIAQRAKEAADSQAGADLGSALHTFTERLDKGEKLTIPEPHARDIEAYRLALEMTGIVTAVGWIERVLFIPIADDFEVIGTTDRVNSAMEWSLPRIGDVKTATDKPQADNPSKFVNTILTYGMVDIPLQLAMYAHATHWWNVDAEQWVEMISVDQDVAMVFHVPAGLGECRIYEVDIAAGWQAVIELAYPTRLWRKRKDLYQTIICVDANRSTGKGSVDGDTESAPPTDPPNSPAAANEPDEGAESKGRRSPKGGEEAAGEGSPFPDDPAKTEDPPAPPSSGSDPMSDPDAYKLGVFIARCEWVRDRVNEIKKVPAAKSRLAGLWSLRPEIPTFPKGGPQDADQLSAVIGMCDLVEMEFQMPFGPSDPHPPERASISQRRRDRQAEQEEAKAKAMNKAQRARKVRT